MASVAYRGGRLAAADLRTRLSAARPPPSGSPLFFPPRRKKKRTPERRPRENGETDQKRMRSSIQARTSFSGTRTCSMVSRSRMVTDCVSSVSKSTQMLKGVPISSCRR